MENKINLVEILKDCPIGTKLYSPLCGECKLDTVTCKSILVESITFKTLHFNEDGTYYEGYDDAECLLFPSKENRDWSKFQRPFKDGDVVAGENCACSYIAIFKEFIDDTSFSHHACLTSFGKFSVDDISDNANLRLATPKENEKLFDAINDKGYRWNDETKALVKWVKPKFKVGDRIKAKDDYKKYITDGHVSTITSIKDGKYWSGIFAIEYINEQDKWELVHDKFDINNLKHFDKVLVRDDNEQKWKCQIFDSFDASDCYPFKCISSCYKYCIPYEGNEHLPDTTNDCDEFYKTWK